MFGCGAICVVWFYWFRFCYTVLCGCYCCASFGGFLTFWVCVLVYLLASLFVLLSVADCSSVTFVFDCVSCVLGV